MDIGQRIRELRKSKNLTITALAKEIEITREFMSSLENNRYIPTLPTLEKICEVLNITLSDFFNEGTEPIALTPELKELLENAKELTPEQLEQLTKFIKTLK
ncbi:helix-turn-helix domain-containing protein [Clostridium sp. SYSU_GA19001]|uniref:helix-turn-helix domain-containing protein n=1 Tax=Clostridium caldaquaticum TaxID=2940653 RepID=UPI0020776956|nr:helix-turn-helix transcriptional regulator [Clostridium caldaquaticum]MCM8710502.1 helix-turn-helix domain-containing protein [Clostridium caldaquaticum]